VAAELSREEPERRVRFEIADGVKAFGDPSLLQGIVQNLTGNAWKYTSREKDARIEFGGDRKDGEVVCFVRDNGVGFDPAYAEKLFVAFQRLHGESEFEGLGLGLAAVQRIVRRHGGRVWAETNPDRRAVFYFVLPA